MLPRVASILDSDHSVPGEDFDRFDPWHFAKHLPITGFTQHAAQRPNGTVPAMRRFVKVCGLNVIGRDLIHAHPGQRGLQDQTPAVFVISFCVPGKRRFVEPLNELLAELTHQRCSFGPQRLPCLCRDPLSSFDSLRLLLVLGLRLRHKQPI